LLGFVGNEGYAYVDHRRRTTHDEDDDDESSERDDDDEDAVDQVRWYRGLRTYVRSNCHYHQQKILDVLAHNYNDWENEYRPQLPYEQELDHPTARGAPMSQALPTVGPGGTSSAGWRPLTRRRLRPTPHRRRVDDLAELIGDGQYAAPVVRLARFHSTCGGGDGGRTEAARPGQAESFEGGPITYMYTYDGKQPSDDVTADDADNADNSAVTSARPASGGGGGGYKRDLAYAFGAPLAVGIDPFAMTNDAYKEADRQLARTVLTYWTNFIRTGSVIYRRDVVR